MWDCIVLDGDMSWLVEALHIGTAIGTADGLYSGYSAQFVSGAGWIIYDTATGNQITGSFFKTNKAASSYLGKLLGLYTLHAFLLSMVSFYTIADSKIDIYCDNTSALCWFNQ